MALGMAISQRILGNDSRCYALLSDGECNEGYLEAAMFAAGQHLHHLTAVVDYNKWQATGRSQEVMALDPSRQMGGLWVAYSEINGHDMVAIINALDSARSETTKPSVIVAHTIKGKVTFMEDDNNWHYRIPNPQEMDAALAELQGESGEIHSLAS